MQNPLVTVIIPTYNRTHFLKLTLESIKSQTFQDFEIIVIDDGTAGDDNRLLCEKFEKVNYIKIINSGGPAKPRNIGIQKAKGKYIAFVDDDDLWLPEKLTQQVAILEANLDFGLVHGCCQVIDQNSVITGAIVGRPGTPDVKHGDVSMRMLGNWTVMMPTSLVRKKVIAKVGFFNENMPPAGEDVEFWTRCSFVTKFYYLDELLVLYRVHSNNISRLNKYYIELPLYLKKILVNVYNSKKINKTQYKLLLRNLCHMQLKTLRIDIITSLKKLFQIDYFWFLEINSFKLLLKKLITKEK